MKSLAMVQFQFLKRRRFLENCLYVFFLAGVFFPLLFSLPIQFQSINDETASGAGVRLIPLVLGISAFTVVSNWIVTKAPRYSTLLMLGAALSITGSSLISSAGQEASTAIWIVFELVTAAGVGLALQIPMISNQASVAASDIPTATSMTLFFEIAGQALFTAAGEAAFINQLLRKLDGSPQAHIDPDVVIAAGATGFRKIFSAAQVSVIIRCYIEALKVNHLLSVGCGVGAGLVWLSMASPNLKQKVSGRISSR